MGHARKRSGRARSSGTSRSAPALFFTGVAVGAIAMLLALRWDQLEPGGGLRALLERSASEPIPPPVVIAPTAPEVEAPRLEFYEVLPEFERLLPDPEPEPEPPTVAAVAPPQPPADPAQIDAGVSYVLQAGSYARFADADRLKAELALGGMEAHIQQVTIEDRGIFYRVRLGPFQSVAELDRIDARLREQGIQPLRLRVSGAAG